MPAISPRPELTLPLLLVASGAGFVPLGWGWLLPGVALATGALLTILSDPDRRPRQATSGARSTRTAPGRWATETLLQPRKHLGFGGGLIYVLIVTLLANSATVKISATAMSSRFAPRSIRPDQAGR